MTQEEKVVYCMENQQEGLDYGKHNFIYVKGFGISCEFCFLPKEKANFKPLVKRFKDKDGTIWLDHNCQSNPCPHGKTIFVEVVTQ